MLKRFRSWYGICSADNVTRTFPMYIVLEVFDHVVHIYKLKFYLTVINCMFATNFSYRDPYKNKVNFPPIPHTSYKADEAKTESDGIARYIIFTSSLI